MIVAGTSPLIDIDLGMDELLSTINQFVSERGPAVSNAFPNSIRCCGHCSLLFADITGWSPPRSSFARREGSYPVPQVITKKATRRWLLYDWLGVRDRLRPSMALALRASPSSTSSWAILPSNRTRSLRDRGFSSLISGQNKRPPRGRSLILAGGEGLTRAFPGPRPSGVSCVDVFLGYPAQ